jgi:hypothetical protein
MSRKKEPHASSIDMHKVESEPIVAILKKIIIIKMSHRILVVMIYPLLEHIFLIITDAPYAREEGDAFVCC